MANDDKLYQSETNDIVDTLAYMLIHDSVPRMDINLEEGRKAKVYWAGNVLRVDIEGLK